MIACHPTAFWVSARFVLCALLLPWAHGAAFAKDEVQVAKDQLNRQIALMETIEVYVERLDIARLQILKSQSQIILDSIEEHGLANLKTIHAYQQLIVYYRYSFSFFRQISFPETEDEISELIKITEKIREARGFDDTPYTQITAHVFEYQHRLFVQLRDSTSMPDQLKRKIEELIAPIGKVIAIARQGDRPNTFKAAIPLYHRIVALYQDFSLIERSNAAFYTTLEIQGLNEFYGEFAQVEVDSEGPENESVEQK